MEVVINACFGGFSLSPKALLWLWDQGVTEIGTEASKYYRETEEYLKDLNEWKLYCNENSDFSSVLAVFSPDEKFILSPYCSIKRNHPKLVECVKLLGSKANGSCSELKIIEIPDDVKFEIERNEGYEHVAEVHRTWS